jgi:hypothetical protein
LRRVALSLEVRCLYIPATKKHSLAQRKQFPHLLAAADVNTLKWACITGSAILAERHILGERLSSLFYENSLLAFISGLELDVAQNTDRICADDRAGSYSESPTDELQLQTTACRKSAS